MQLALVVPRASPKEEDARWSRTMLAERQRIVGYIRKRAAAKERAGRRVQAAGLFVQFGLGYTLFAIAIALKNRGTLTTNATHAFMGASYFTIVMGTAVVMTSDHDLNHLLSNEGGGGRCFSFGIGAVLAFALLGFLGHLMPATGPKTNEYAAAPLAVVALFAFARRRAIVALRPGAPLPTEVIGVLHCIFCVGAAGYFIRHEGAQQGWGKAGLAAAICMFGYWGCQWLTLARVSGLPRWVACEATFHNPTLRYIGSAAIVTTALSMSRTVASALPDRSGRRDLPMAAVAFFPAMVPLTAVLRWRADFFGLFARVFERRQRLQDGAVLAVLLSHEPRRAGDEWWVLLGEGAQARWARGAVASADAESITVQLPDGVVLPAGTARRVTVAAAGSMLGVEELLRCASMTLFRVRVSEELLRCLMSDAPPIGYTCTSPASHVVTACMEVLREPCSPGQVDWFLSHSWHDEPALKAEALALCAARFEQRSGRPPSMWLDAACVHPAYKQEALKCLPIYMAACRGVLLVIGRTYFQRLWCMWELYSIFLFASAEVRSQPDVTVAILDRGGGTRTADEDRCFVSDGLKCFCLADAHCSDPNEERKLRTAIDAAPGGAAAFQAAIQRLGGASCRLFDDAVFVVSPGCVAARTLI
jgi:hypothetical protein